MPRRAADEDGFVLVAAMWLLLLAGAIVADLMLRGMAQARETRSDGAQLQATLDRESIEQGVVADLAIDGRRSFWSTMPVQARVALHGRTYGVRLSSDGARTNLNTVDLGALDRALMSLAVPAEARGRVTADLAARRAQGRPLRSWAEVLRAVAPINAAGLDPTDRVTLFGGGGADRLMSDPQYGSTVGPPADLLAGASVTPTNIAPTRLMVGHSGAFVLFEASGFGEDPVLVRQ